jgi:hypothetical protein
MEAIPGPGMEQGIIQRFEITSDADLGIPKVGTSFAWEDEMTKTILWAAASLSAIAFFTMLPDIKRYIKISSM